MIRICSVILILAGCASPTIAPVATTSSRPAAEQSLVAPAGSSVRDGKFEFTVLKYGSSPNADQARPQGIYVMVEMTVENIGNEPQTFFAGNQKLRIDNRTYAPDSMASIYLDSATVDINPGNIVTVTIAFDVPANTDHVNTLELHDSAFSRGVEVAL